VIRGWEARTACEKEQSAVAKRMKDEQNASLLQRRIFIYIREGLPADTAQFGSLLRCAHRFRQIVNLASYGNISQWTSALFV